MTDFIIKNRLFIKVTFFVIMIHLTSCASLSSRPSEIQESQYSQSKSECYSKDRVWQASSFKSPKNGVTHLANFSATSVQIANLIGVQVKIQKLIEVRKQKKIQQQEWIDLRQEVLEQVQLIQADIAVAIAELDCEKERTEILTAKLQRQGNDRSQNLSLVAIIVGAVGAVATAGLSLAGLETTSDVIAITTGAAVAGIGLKALEDVQEHDLSHSKNPLREVWLGPSSAELLPPVVWIFLSSSIVQGKPTTRRESLIEEWKHYEWLGNSEDSKNHRIILYFGKGGKYTLSELRDRAQILDVLKDEISLAYRYVGIFLRDFLKFCS